jgi:hypothetical protein
MDAETLYRQLGRLIESVPEFPKGTDPTSAALQQWLGRAYALIQECGDLAVQLELDRAVHRLDTAARGRAPEAVMLAIYKALGLAELKAPPGAQGAFIPVGASFDAFAAITKVFTTATSDVFIVDPYMDEAALTVFGRAAPEGITLRLLSDQASVKPSLAPAATAWASQYGPTRPLGVRLAAPKALHDRAIFIDGEYGVDSNAVPKGFGQQIPSRDHTC